MFEPEELMARIADLESQLKVSEMAPPYAEQLIACLEGEIAKRDARIVELESGQSADMFLTLTGEITQLRAELAAIKAQEPVAWVGAIEDGVPLLVVEPQNWKATPLYATPVQQVSVPDGRVKFSRFLTDAMTAAGLLRHGKTDKALASRISSASMEYMLAAPAAPAADAGVISND